MKIMKRNELDTVLISPSSFYEDNENIWTEVNSNFPPLGLASIAAVVREKGFSVKIIDSNVFAPAVDLFEKFFIKNFVEKYEKIRFIGLTAMTPTIKKAYKIAEICKKYYPKSKIVIGGVHATFLSDEVINKECVDIVVFGEGEMTFLDLLKGKSLSKIDGIIYKKKIKGKVIIKTNKPRERILNLDELPMPAYDLLPIKSYRPAKGTYKRLPAMSMMTSRGCPGRCTFCNKTLGNRLVFKSAKKIFKEIKYLIRNYGIKQILFYDDTFTVYKKNVMDLCNMIIKTKTDISWTCFARVDFIDFEMLKMMKKAGCHQIMYGVENVDQKILNNINKKINPEQVVKAVKWTKKAGIECRLAFMVGNPGDSRKSVERNIKFVNKVNPDLLIVNITTPFPGTAMFQWAKEKDLILTYDWDDYTLAKPIMKLEDMSTDDIKRLYKLMYRSFYLRPRYIIGRLFKIRSFGEIKMLASGFTSILSFLKIKKKK
ncbi:B12-binding domain-containing radical SAM protein [Nanoarchaeota archaeon]